MCHSQKCSGFPPLHQPGVHIKTHISEALRAQVFSSAKTPEASPLDICLEPLRCVRSPWDTGSAPRLARQDITVHQVCPPQKPTEGWRCGIEPKGPIDPPKRVPLRDFLHKRVRMAFPKSAASGFETGYIEIKSGF